MMRNLTLTNRIYLSMIAFLVLSFLVIGGVTINFFGNQNEEYHKQRLIRKEATIMDAIEYFIKAEDRTFNPIIGTRMFTEKVYELADVNKLDLNIYTLSGKLLVSSNPSLYKNGILDSVISKKVLDGIKGGQPVYIDAVKSDTITLLNSYQEILDLAGYPIAIANIPYFDVNKQMSVESNKFLRRLGETYLFFFIIALGIAFYLAKYITRSLKTVAETIKSTRINKKNEPLVWDSSDEIGVVVEEYNRMLQELEKSAEILAKTERETAWREMAKQVAHEIKNPLTPMKLSVQQLQRSLKPDDPNFNEKLQRFSQSLVDQIDTLSSISSSFSRFATLPKMELKNLDLSMLLQNTAELYSDRQIGLNLEENIVVKADREQFIRVIHNLLQNAFQAIPETKKPQVNLVLKVDGNHAFIEVSDNGTGIDHSQEDKIFEPSFTTKTGGMGLGLAIVKRIVSSHQGEIGFSSQQNKGTTFWIKIPLASE